MNSIITADGSSTIYVPELDEHYHSTFGAITESKHVFIMSGLKPLIKADQKISVFEAGFGTGLNALLTCLEAMNQGCDITYHSVELFPVNAEDAANLNYSEILGGNTGEIFSALHHAEWNKIIRINQHFSLHKILTDLTSFIPEFTYDLIFFDAFAPDKQPAMWIQEIISRLFRNLNDKGVMVTYCAKGEVRRRMQRAGYLVERIPGPPGKREMLRGLKKITHG